jgi:hypothetical protein
VRKVSARGAKAHWRIQLRLIEVYGLTAFVVKANGWRPAENKGPGTPLVKLMAFPVNLPQYNCRT